MNVMTVNERELAERGYYMNQISRLLVTIKRATAFYEERQKNLHRCLFVERDVSALSCFSAGTKLAGVELTGAEMAGAGWAGAEMILDRPICTIFKLFQTLCALENYEPLFSSLATVSDSMSLDDKSYENERALALMLDFEPDIDNPETNSLFVTY
uniref:Uncharacterized protein n=1 Tax=Romanomermis culicivorax TaxID=13658 RepID=A0A915K4D8_ROMCU